MTSPLFLITTESGAIRPEIIDTSVLLPLPFAPAITVQPSEKDKDRFENNITLESGYVKEILLSSKYIKSSRKISADSIILV